MVPFKGKSGGCAFLRSSMKLESHHIQTFKKLYEEKYGVCLEDQEALEIATKVVRLVEIVEEHSCNN